MYYRNKLFLIAILLFPAFAKAESGYDLWLRYQGGQKATVTLAKGLRSTPTLDIARNELTQYWQGSETLTLESAQAEGFFVRGRKENGEESFRARFWKENME